MSQDVSGCILPNSSPEAEFVEWNDALVFFSARQFLTLLVIGVVYKCPKQLYIVHERIFTSFAHVEEYLSRRKEFVGG